MLAIPAALQAQFEEYLRNKAIPNRLHGEYRKWLRYYLDFCGKHHLPPIRQESLPRFIHKLQEKKQSKDRQGQAVSAITMYYEMVMGTTFPKKTPLSSPVPPPKPLPFKNEKPLSSHERTVSPLKFEKVVPPLSPDTATIKQDFPRALNPPGKASVPMGSGASWKEEYSRLADEIQVRHYSPKTLQIYRGWVQKFQAFTRSKGPELLSSRDVKAFLTFLAVKRKVSAITQNQAFNSLLFFYRHVLDKEFGKVDGVVRAKRKPYLPVVLSRKELDKVLKHLEPPFDLVVKLLYGCGLCLSECLGLRVHCLNFEAEILTVHDGKGQKDRTVPLPERIIPELERHLESLKDLHQQDLDRKYAGVFLMNALEKKYKKAAREFIRQWIFPAKMLTVEKKTGELRRYHLHETYVQKAIKQAVSRAKITKRATAHTFRHPATGGTTHLLQANYDIRTIQTLLGHSDVRTTMIYTHCIPSRTVKEAKSPLDF